MVGIVTALGQSRAVSASSSGSASRCRSAAGAVAAAAVPTELTERAREGAPMEPRADDRQPMEQVLYEVKKVIVGQDQLLERLAIALLARGHVLVEGVPGLAKTLAIKTLADSDRRAVPAHPVHARPRARRPRRHADLQPALRRVHDVTRAGVHEPPARRRDQPRAGEGAERAARGHAGATGDHRARDPRGAEPVPRDGHAEPDRVRGHLSAARGAGRPVHAEGARGRTRRRPRSS